MSDSWVRIVTTSAVAAAAFGAFLCATYVLRRILRKLGERAVMPGQLAEHAHLPLRWFAAAVTLRIAVEFALPSGSWRNGTAHALTLAVIATGAWLLASVLRAAEQTMLCRLPDNVPDNRQARRLETQITVVRRVIVAAISALALGAILMTFPELRTAGTSLLASAGVIGAIAALAAQSLLANVFAGLQIAFSDAIRIDDAVVVEGSWGRVEEITLTYVVVHVWDDRRLVIPTSQFMSKSFENWTRRETAMQGTVELDLDWTVPVEEMREELRRILEATDLWDGRTNVLQVTDAVNTLIRVRALVSAADASTLFALRCHVRERLVRWIRHRHPYAIPQVRTAHAAAAPAVHDNEHDDEHDDRRWDRHDRSDHDGTRECAGPGNR